MGQRDTFGRIGACIWDVAFRIWQQLGGVTMVTPMRKIAAWARSLAAGPMLALSTRMRPMAPALSTLAY